MNWCGAETLRELAAFEAAIEGSVVLAGSPDYELVRKSPWAQFEDIRPAAVVVCTCASGNPHGPIAISARRWCELVAVADEVQLGDPSADDGEGDHGERASGRPDHGACDAVDDRGPSKRRQAGAREHTFGDGGRAADRRLRFEGRSH